MKRIKNILLFWILSLNFYAGFAQDYTPFYQDDARWVMERIIPVLGLGDGYQFWEIYTLNDTTINTQTYRKVATRNIGAQWPDSNGDLYFDQTIVTGEYVFGGIREEDQKVYFYRFDTTPQWNLLQNKITWFDPNQEYLLYDFSAQPGDTVHYHDLYYHTVLNGDTTFHLSENFSIILDSMPPIQGHQQQRIVSSSTFIFPHKTSVLTQGIGTSNGFFGSYDSHLVYLRCFSLQDTTLLYDEECNPYPDYVTLVDQVAEQKAAVKIFPNPSTGPLRICSQNQRIISIRVMDIMGKTLLQKNGAAQEIDLDLTSLINQQLLCIWLELEDGKTQTQQIVLSP